jgi:hypothetical protein
MDGKERINHAAVPAVEIDKRDRTAACRPSQAARQPGELHSDFSPALRNCHDIAASLEL